MESGSGIPIPPVPEGEPSNRVLLVVLNAQSITLNKLDRTMHGERPDGSDGVKARMLHLETRVEAHARRFAKSDKLLRKGVWGFLSMCGAALFAWVVAKFKIIWG